MAKIVSVTATDVREFFKDNPKMVPANDKTVGRAPSEHRGRLSPAAQEVFERETGRKYVAPSAGGPVKGAVDLKVSYTQPSGRSTSKTVSLTVKEIRALAGDKAKAKGRLTSDAIEAAQTALGERLTAESAAAKAAKSAKAPKVTEAPVEADES